MSISSVDILANIFKHYPILGTMSIRLDRNLLNVCKRWRQLFTDINFLVRLAQIPKCCNGFLISLTFMKITKTAPTTNTIKLLCWEFEGMSDSVFRKKITDRRLMQLFVSCYNSETWGTLPMPSHEDLATSVHRTFCDFLHSLDRGEASFKHLISLYPKLPSCGRENSDRDPKTLKIEERLIAHVLSNYERKILSLEFVEWFLAQDFFSLCPFAIAEMTKYLPFELVKKYANMKMQSGYRGDDRYATDPSKYNEIAYYEAFREYKFNLTHVTERNGLSDDKRFDLSVLDKDDVEGFVYFYHRCPMWRVVDSFSHIQNSVNYYRNDDSKDNIQKYLEYFEELYCINTVHDINEIWCYDWYKPKYLTKIVNREEEERKYRAGQPSVFKDVYPDGC